jgi:hypothetical protein
MTTSDLDNSDEFNPNDFKIHDDESLKNYFNNHTQGDSDKKMEINDTYVSHRNRPLTLYQRDKTQEEEDKQEEKYLFADFERLRY